MRARRRSSGLLAAGLCALLALPALFLVEASSDRVARAQVSRPNIVLIVTDDQRADSLVKMPNVQRYLVDKGMRLDQAIVSDPLCCPSRAAILTGRYAHSTGVYSNKLPFGGWPLFNSSGAESATFATALHDAGYRTALIGKYMNEYDDAGAFVPPGWDRWFAFATANGFYYDYTIYDGNGFVHFGRRPRAYSTDVFARRAVAFIRNTDPAVPLLLMLTPYAPHGPITPAPRHVGAFSGAHVTIGPAVSEKDVSDKPRYIRGRSRRSLDDVRRLTRRTWESLLAVDELVADVVGAMRETGRVGDTLFLFTTDNGFSFDEHRWRGKAVPYEESIRVPFVVRLDGEVPAGTVSNALVSNVDIAPTFVDFGGGSLPGVDGTSIRPLVTDAASTVRDSVLVEALRGTNNETTMPTYCGVRTRSFSFVRYATGEEELYDLVPDRWQLENVVEERPAKANELRNLAIALCDPVPPGFSW